MGLANYVETVPGSDVKVCLGVHEGSSVWHYSLWSGEGDDETMLHLGSVDLSGLEVTPRQVAKIAVLLEVDYSGA